MSVSTSASNTPPSEEVTDTETSSMIMLMDDGARESVPNPSVDMEVLLEKQLLLEKTRVGTLTNDNQRLLSQNITLCQAIKQQKLEIDHLLKQNTIYKSQVSRLFVSVTKLTQTNEHGVATSLTLQQEFDVLKQALQDKEQMIQTLKAANQQLSYSFDRETQDHNACRMALSEVQTQNKEYESTIQCHLKSIEEFNETIDKMQDAMKSKQKEIETAIESKQQIQDQLTESRVATQKMKDALDQKEKEMQSLREQLQWTKKEMETYSSRIEQHEAIRVETVRKLEEVQSKYEEVAKQREWWKSEATTLEKECQINVTKLHEVKAQLNSAENNKFKGINVDLWRKRFYSSLWKRFSEFVMFQQALQQMHDLTVCMKQKYQTLKGKEDRQPLGESFKISMLKSLKDVKNVNIDELLLCQDTKQLTDFILSSKMSQDAQLKIAAQLLPVVERHRIKLQRDINSKIDKIINKRSKKEGKENAIANRTD